MDRSEVITPGADPEEAMKRGIRMRKGKIHSTGTGYFTAVALTAALAVGTLTGCGETASGTAGNASVADSTNVSTATQNGSASDTAASADSTGSSTDRQSADPAAAYGNEGDAVSVRGYTEEVVKKRDIISYRSFTGTIEPVTERNVLPDVTGAKIASVKVEEGDEVKAGDVLVELDPKQIQNQIDQLEATMSVAEKQSALQVSAARQAYANEQINIANGQEPQILSAMQAVDGALAQLVSAQQQFNNEVTLNNRQLSAAILQAMSQVDSAYIGLQQAELSQSQAKQALTSAQSSQAGPSNAGLEQLLAQAGLSGNAIAGLGSVGGSDTTSAQNQVDAANLSVESAQTNYDNAVQMFEAAKLNEENQLTVLYDNLITAQTQYCNALDSYNTVVNSANQQLSTLNAQVRQAEAASDMSASEVQLAQLYDSLADCTVTAPIDGVVTTLTAQEGDMAATGMALATITNFDRLKVEIKINEYDIAGAAVGEPVKITVDATGEQYDGTITKIARSATIAAGVSYFAGEVEFDGTDSTRTGMSVEAKMTISDREDVLSIPSAAIQTDSDGTAYVILKNGDDTKNGVKHAIGVGASDGTYTEITAGLSEGDVIWTEPVNPYADMMNMSPAAGGAGGADGE